MKKLLGILVLGLLWCNVEAKAESIGRLKDISDKLIVYGPDTVDYSFECVEPKKANNNDWSKILYLFGFSQKIEREWAHRRYGNKEKGKYLLDESFVKNAEDGSTSEWYYLIGSNTRDFSNDNFPNGKQIRKHIMKRLSQSEYELFIKQVKIDAEAAIYLLELDEKRLLDQNPRAVTFDQEKFGYAIFKLTKAYEIIFKKFVDSGSEVKELAPLACRVYE